jgi:hypothetical protein
VPVPTPDASAFERRVRRLRRRRTSLVAAGAAAAVVVSVGVSMQVAGQQPEPLDRTRSGPLDQVRAGGPMALVLDGRLRTLSARGELGPEGMRVVRLAGTTPEGVVAVTDEGAVARISSSGETVTLVDAPVRIAIVAGDDLVYQGLDDQVHWRRISPEVATADHRTVAGLRLLGAGPGMAVIAGTDGVVLRDAAGTHRLQLVTDTRVIHQADAAGGVVALRTDRGDVLFTDHGRRAVTLPGDRYAALAPDGHTYARATASRTALEMIDPATGAATPVPGLAGRVVDLAWADETRLYVVVAHGRSRTLWSCPSGAGCGALLTDASGSLTLR